MSEDHTVAGEDERRSDEAKRRETLDTAHRVPGMFTGSMEHGHRYAVRGSLGLVWTARAFFRPKATTVILSPRQYVVRSECGRLKPEIEALYSWQARYLLDADWRTVIWRLMDEYDRSILSGKRRARGWRYHFGNSTGGAKIDSPLHPSVLARWFGCAYRTSQGLWCQTYADGWPVTDSFLLTDRSPVGLLAAAWLTDEYFTGLPFNETDVERLQRWPNVTVQWHPEDDLIDPAAEPVAFVRRWL